MIKHTVTEEDVRKGLDFTSDKKVGDEVEIDEEQAKQLEEKVLEVPQDTEDLE